MSHETERIVTLRLTPHELYVLRDTLHTRLQEVHDQDLLPASRQNASLQNDGRVMRLVLDQLEVARRPEAVA